MLGRACILLPVLLLSACAAGPGRSAGETPLALRVTNESRDRVTVYLARDESTPERLGLVGSVSQRTFRIRRSPALGARFRLFSVPVGSELGEVDVYSTLPFRVGDGHDVLWAIRDGRRLSAVTLHAVRR